MRAFLFAALCIVIIGISGFFYLRSYGTQPRNPKASFEISIDKGSSLYSVSRLLQEHMEIGSPKLFVKLGQIYGYADRIKFGEYTIPSNVSLFEIFEILVAGKTKKYKFTFVEGSHIYDLAKLLSKNGFGSYGEILAGLKDPKIASQLVGENVASLEGYLYPDTYFYEKSETPSEIVSRMVDRFKEVYSTMPIEKNMSLNRHQIVTLASIVEKETGAPFERPMIASVFLNRIRKKMRLETDPTVMYGVLHNTGKEIKNIKRIHLKTPTEYNTYTIKGLPPGPIGNPGKEALIAIFRPQKSTHLFFVSRNNGTHVFTDTYDEHLKAVRNFQLNPKAREGKSWRNLKKAQ